MSNEYLRLNDTNMNIEKAENLIAIIAEKRKDAETQKEVQSESSLFSELFKAFKDFFSKLGKPTIQNKPLKVASPARSSDYNDRMQELFNDVHVAYDETDSLASAMVKDFNYSESERQMLLNKVRSLNSTSTDYSFYSEGAKTKSIFATDDFIDNSKIDISKTSPGIQTAEIVVNQGVVTLKRTGNIDRSGLVTRITGIKESIAPWNPAAETGGYEGLYFGMRNEPRPEGGVFHLTYAQDGSRVYEMGASEEEKMPRRLQMFDNNPNTFWEVEYVTNPIAGYRTPGGTQISVAEFNDLINNNVNSPNATTSGGTVVTDEHGSLVEGFVPMVGSSPVEYLACTFVVDLSTAEYINWISLNPNNFAQELYMEILSIQTSANGSSFSELDGFDDHEFETMLTAEANRELTPAEVQDTLSPDRFKYAGQGVWVFAPRLTKAIKFNLRQTRSYLKNYEVLMVQLQQTTTTTTTYTPSDWDAFWGDEPTTSTTSSTSTRTIEIPYLTGHFVGFDVMNLEGASGNKSGQQEENMIAHVAGSVTGFYAGAVVGSVVPVIGTVVGAVIGAVIGWICGGWFESTTTTATSRGPETLSKQWTVTKNDKARFAIGIRDINMYSYVFAATSEVVSKPYVSPTPISKLALQVEEQIPNVFYSGSNAGTDNDWIKYYISVNNGTSWNRISPTHHRSTISEDGVNPVPEIININSDVTGADRENPLAYVDIGTAVYTVRFKAVLSRPTDIQNAESFTPVLSKYALQIYPVGGL